MLGIEVELLGGRFVASTYNDREMAEWPPHPARLYSALVATWAETEPHSAQSLAERSALEWLEAQPAPDIVADALSKVARRTVMPVFVPVNDTGVIKQPERERELLARAQEELAEASTVTARDRATTAVQKAQAALGTATRRNTAPPQRYAPAEVAEAESLLPEHRGRQARTFPSVTPPTPRVRYVWRVEAPAEVAAGLAALTGRLVRLGHSSSLVASRLVGDHPPPSYVVDEAEGDLVLRWVAKGQFGRLQEAYARHQEIEPRVMPAIFVNYREAGATPQQAVVNGVFSTEMTVFARVGGPRLPITSAVGVARQLSRALQSCADQPVAEVISGHAPDGSPSQRPHLAVVPLPFVGHRHGDGGIRGIAVVLPRELPTAERRAVMVAIARLEAQARADSGSEEDPPVVSLHLGDSGSLRLQRVAWTDPGLAALRASTWSRPAREWITATPIALDENPGDLHDDNPERRAKAFAEAEACVARAVEHIGLPRPDHVEVSRSVLLPGSAKPRSFPRFPVSRERPQRVLVHARLVFGAPVRGPVLLGAGRYLGLGLCRPMEVGGEDE